VKQGFISRFGHNTKACLRLHFLGDHKGLESHPTLSSSQVTIKIKLKRVTRMFGDANLVGAHHKTWVLQRAPSSHLGSKSKSNEHKSTELTKKKSAQKMNLSLSSTLPYLLSISHQIYQKINKGALCLMSG